MTAPGPYLGATPASPSRAGLEVETEYEDEGDEEEEEAAPEEVEEVDEDEEDEGGGESLAGEEAASVSSSGAAGSGARDYAVPEQNKEVWKAFGHDTEAGRMLRRLYASGQAKEASSRVAYPALRSGRKWEPQPAARKPCPQQAPVRVPRVTHRPRADPDDPRHWRVPAGGKKPAHEIIAEMEAAAPERPRLQPGRDGAKEKRGLQDRFRYCGGQMMPKGAMGNVPQGDIPAPAPRPEAPGHVDPETGMTREQREIFEELTKAVQWKQARIAEIDAQDAEDPNPSREKTERNKEALQLKNDIEECLRNVKTLMKITE